MTDLIKNDATDVALPDYLQKYKNEGVEDINIDDLQIEYLQTAQDKSQVIQNKIGDIELGDFYSSILNKRFGNSVDIIVIKRMTRWVKIIKGKFAAASNSGKFWEVGNEYSGKPIDEEDAWKCKRNDFFVLIRNNLKEVPYLFSVGGTSFKESKNLVNLLRLRMEESEPIFGRTYNVSSEKTEEYYTLKIKQVGFSTAEEVELASKVRSKLNKMKNTVTANQINDEAPNNLEDNDLEDLD